MDDDSRITIGQGGWFLLLFGLVFAGFGCFFIAALLLGGDVTVNGRRGKPADAWMPGIFVVVGLGIAGIRYRRLFLADERVIETHMGWMLWTRVKREEVGAWKSIELRPAESRGSGSSRYTAVPVNLVGDAGTCEIDAPRSEAKARILAQRLARAAHIPLVDATAGLSDPVEIPADLPAQPLLQRIRDADLAAPAPDRLRMRLEEQSSGVRIRMAPSSALFLAPFALIPLSIPVAFWWFAWRPGLQDKADRSLGMALFYYAPLLMAVIPAIGMALRALRNGTFGYSIDVDPRDGLRALGRHIAAEELLDLRVISTGRTRCLRALGDRSEIKLGDGLGEEELAWLRAAILRALR